MNDAALPVTTPIAPGATQRQDPEWQAHLRGQQLALLARQSTRTPFAIAIACGFVAWTVRGHAPLPLVAVWAGLLLAMLFVRRAYAQRLLREPPADAQPHLKRMVVFNLANGIMLGAAAMLFFPDLTLEGRALLTMILVCWTAGGVAATAAYAPAFYVFVTAGLVPLSLMWAIPFNPEDAVIGLLVMLFGLFQILFVRDNERVFCESFLIRFENERLLDALERERQEVLLARDRAEDASRAKSRFLAAASHDLRQPLHALALYSGALSLRSADAGSTELVAQIDNTVSALSALFESLLDISKLDAGAVKPELRRIDVAAVIDRIKSEFKAIAQEKGLEFLVSSSDATVETDPVLFERILRNLVDNAIRYTKSGTVELSTRVAGNGLRIAVSDTGPGIPEGERERIFEEFYQIGNSERDRRAGLGLGLALVRRLAKLLDIPIEMSSEPGKGSTFAVTLPRVARITVAERPQPATSTPVATGELAGAHVLVLDDEPAVRLGMRALLEVWGCQVTACSGYVEAERMIAKYSLQPDLIIADFRLREHETGIDAVRHLRSTLGDVPALLISGDTAPERLSEAQASGIPLLSKPVNPDTLKERVKALLEKLNANNDNTRNSMKPQHAGAYESIDFRRRRLLGVLGAAGAASLFPAGCATTTGSDTPRRIDVHHHIVSPGYSAALKARGQRHAPWTIEGSLADMDKSGIATSVSSLIQPAVWFGDVPLGRKLAREANEFAVKLARDYPGRFGTFATIPYPDTEGSIKEIAYALDTLEAEGFCLMTSYGGKYLGDPAFWPVLEELDRRSAVVYTHPLSPQCCGNVVPGVAGSTIEYATDTTRTMASLVFTGAASKYPNIRWIFSHSGGTTPFLLSRFLQEEKIMKDRAAKLPRGVMYELAKFYYDTAQGNHTGALAALLKMAPVSQLLYGTDYPFRDGAEVNAGLAAYGFSAAELQAINRDNALRMMPQVESLKR